MRNRYLRTGLWTLAIALCAIPAAAQDDRVRLSIGTAATTGRDDSLALTASVGYRFLERVSFEVDVTATDSPVGDLGFRPLMLGASGPGGMRMDRITRGPGFVGRGTIDPMRGPQFERAIFPPVRPAPVDGHTVLATAGFRYELPVQGGRLHPYLGAGLGIARTDEEITLQRSANSLSRTGMAASAGAGASLRVFRQLFVDVDARYFRLDRERNLTRLGGGVSYRF